MIKAIVVTINGDEVYITVDEAKQLYNSLSELFFDNTMSDNMQTYCRAVEVEQ